MNNLKKVLYGLAAVAVAIVTAFWAGRYSKPAEIHTQYVKGETKVEWKTQTVVQYVDRIVHTTTTTKTVEKPDGTKETTTTTNTDKDTHSGSQSSVASGSIDTKTEQGKSDIINKRPDWRVSGKVGVLVDRLSFDANPRILYGAEVERRVLGSLWVGAFVLTDAGAPALRTSLKPGATFAGGLALSLEF